MIFTKVDYHSHILPGIDDGAKNLEISRKMLIAAEYFGIEEIYATPHFYMHRSDVAYFCQRRSDSYEKLRSIASDIPVLLGAEVLLFPGLENLPGIERLCMENSDCLLLELPLSRSIITEEHLRSAENLAKRFSVIIAHANRYPENVVVRLIEAGARLQVNAKDVLVRKERKRIEKWLYDDAVYALGSDIHKDLADYKKFDKAYKWLDSF